MTDGRRRVFVAGASGLMGLRLVPLPGDAGYGVAGLTRRPAKLERLRVVPEWPDSEAA